jgi:hypothetical protein
MTDRVPSLGAWAIREKRRERVCRAAGPGKAGLPLPRGTKPCPGASLVTGAGHPARGGTTRRQNGGQWRRDGRYHASLAPSTPIVTSKVVSAPR